MPHGLHCRDAPMTRWGKGAGERSNKVELIPMGAMRAESEDGTYWTDIPWAEGCRECLARAGSRGPLRKSCGRDVSCTLG